MTWVPAGNKYAEVVLTSMDIMLTHIPHLFTDVIMDRLIWEQECLCNQSTDVHRGSCGTAGMPKAKGNH